jgi:8-oxo-dGTP pyrophosphatase MutT (NUDIX family)
VTLAPATPRAAATVVLVRGAGASGCEVYLQKRAATLRFAPGHHVFPGGAVDPEDSACDVVARVATARAFDGEEGVTPAHVAAALRECTEECGVRLDPGALRYFAHWTTPKASPIRFDTRFFLGRPEAGAAPRPCGSEAVEGAFWRPAAALDAFAAGRMRLLPPTEVTLRFVSQFESVEALWDWCADGRLKLAGLPDHAMPPGLAT